MTSFCSGAVRNPATSSASLVSSVISCRRRRDASPNVHPDGPRAYSSKCFAAPTSAIFPCTIVGCGASGAFLYGYQRWIPRCSPWRSFLSRLGTLIEESCLPIRPEVLEFGRGLGLTPMQLASAGGDWQFLYAIPPTRINEAELIALEGGHKLSVVGEFTADSAIAYRPVDGAIRGLDRFEHDSFIPERSARVSLIGLVILSAGESMLEMQRKPVPRRTVDAEPLAVHGLDA